MPNSLRTPSLILTLVFSTLLIATGLPAHAAPELTVGNYQLIASKRISRTVFEYTYKADVTNTGTGALAVSGTLAIANPGLAVIDGTLAFGDVAANATVTSSDTFSVRQDRTASTTEADFLWDIDAISEPSASTLSIDAPDTASLIEGTTRNISYTISLQTTEPQTVIQSQEIIPQDGGLVFTNDAAGLWQSDTDIDWVVNGTLSGNAVDTYTIKTTATIQGTDITTVAETTVEVQSSDPIENVFVGPPVADPDGIPVSAETTVDFSVQVNSGTASGIPDSVVLQEVDAQGALLNELGPLADDGQSGDLVSGDSMYGGSVVVPSSPEGSFYFRAIAWFGTQSVASEPGTLVVTPFPTTLVPSDPATLIESEDPDQRIFANQLVVGFNAGVSNAVIADTVSNVGGEIVGSIPDLNICQIGFTHSKTLEELQALIAAYEAQPDVEFAELAAETTTDAVYPDDPSKGSQNNMQVSRVDEVWLLSSGGGTVAIVDTGVDYNHDDLDVKKGKDFVSDDDDPMDEDSIGHGTHVAGIAAARVNNGKSVAGVTNSKVLAVRGIGGSMAELADAIKWAAGKAAVVNISGGAYSGKDTIEAVTKSLGSKVIVSTSGNDGKSKERYPCANTNVFCVGNSTDADNRASSSNYGSWVDIAAPGENVLSTKLGGGTRTLSGTSMAAPLVAGAARLIWNTHPGWSASQVRQRLLDSAFDAPTLKGDEIGKRIDVFEAFFNGDFELGVEEWSITGTCETKTKLGPIMPTKGEQMLFCSTGPADDQVAATLSKTLQFEANSDFTIKFDYNFVTEEYPEFVGSVFDDSLSIKLVAPDGSETLLAQETVNASSFTPVGGIDFPGGDNTVGQTGWKPVSKTIAVTQGNGSYKIVIEDAGDDIYDSAVLLDNVRLK